MKTPLVSIIIPCYNVEFLIFRLLDSILLQNYSNVEVIAIDDGSTDHTSQVLQSYVDKFKDKKYDFHIYEQINQGLSTTINNGLKRVRGEYLLWPDADDWFDDKATITSMVYVLNNHPEYSCVRVMANYVDEDTMTKTPIAIQSKSKEDLFEDFYYWNNNIWAPAGSHMIRTAKLFSELTDRSIFTNKDGGQNYQLLLPVLYKNRCYTIQKHLYNILVRNGSHSRGAYANYSHQIKRWYDSVELIIHTINNISSMDNHTKTWYSVMTHQRYYLIMANTAKCHHKPIEYFRFIIKYLSFKMKIMLINCNL